MTGLNQSAYSSQCAVGVAASRCALTSDEQVARHRAGRPPPRCAAARCHPVTPPIFIASGMTWSLAPAAIALASSCGPHQFSPAWIGVAAARATSAMPA